MDFSNLQICEKKLVHTGIFKKYMCIIIKIIYVKQLKRYRKSVLCMQIS